MPCWAVDNIFIERLWRTLKYECVYLHAWETGSETKAAIRKRMTFCNHRRPHSALGDHSQRRWSIGREMLSSNPISGFNGWLKVRQILSKRWGVVGCH
ncbi:transposase [Ponticoccus alexandrii]|uniref:Transposase n=1 Tax=Ponticoccus alexandrii TaxID=1943633 RepID=A0ABX7F8D6_9RHOB|nr:transposase [Ponticoccus alexandrii]